MIFLCLYSSVRWFFFLFLLSVLLFFDFLCAYGARFCNECGIVGVVGPCAKIIICAQRRRRRRRLWLFFHCTIVIDFRVRSRENRNKNGKRSSMRILIILIVDLFMWLGFGNCKLLLVLMCSDFLLLLLFFFRVVDLTERNALEHFHVNAPIIRSIPHAQILNICKKYGKNMIHGKYGIQYGDDDFNP